MQRPEAESASIVLIGSFNPVIFQPRWLEAQQLIRPEEAENATITTIQPGVTDFSTEWFHLQVLQERFRVATEDPRQYGPLRDLVMGVFLALSHTPVNKLGINRHFHFATKSIDDWHEIGHKLAPKAPWREIMKMPGMRSVLIEGRREDTSEGVLHVKVEPSLKVGHGVFVEVNEEFAAPKDDPSGGALWAAKCLSTEWESFQQFAEEATQKILRLGT